MNKIFVWVISGNAQMTFKKNGVSSTYIIPRKLAEGIETSLADCNLWLVVRKKDDILTAYIKSNKIEQFLEGYYEGDYLLTASIDCSFRVFRTFTLNKAMHQTLNVGIQEIPFEIHQSLINLITSNIETKVLSAAPRLFSTIVFESAFKNPELIAKTALTKIIQHFSLDEIWGSGFHPKLSPFSNFAYQLILFKLSADIASDALSYLQQSDPIGLLKNILENTHEDKSTISRIPEVDTNFVEIEVETIYARKFVASNEKVIDIKAALEKTEASEKLHQDMLRDICKFLQSQNIVPQYSESVDLMVETKQSTKVFEIKSTNNNNILAQCAKGAFQLTHYFLAISESFGNLKPALIIHKIDNPELENLCIEILKYLNVKCLIYDPSLAWPHRVSGLLTF